MDDIKVQGGGGMSEYDRMKAQKDELLQREREALERPLLAEIDSLHLKNRGLTKQKAELLEACKVIMDGFEKGVFVRDVTKDAGRSWAVRLLPFIAALGKAQAAIAKAERSNPNDA